MFESQLPEKIWLSAILKAFDNGTNMAHAERVIMPKGAKKKVVNCWIIIANAI
jgi:hypothetical protein